MRKAVIDLGTNTFNLLIAEVSEGKFQELYVAREAAMIGDGINDGVISEKALIRANRILEKYRAVCDEYGVPSVRCLGTSALRDASNAAVFKQDVLTKYQFNIEIISGEDEAQFIYQGIRFIDNFQEPGVIMDIGGGSTEFIHADSKGVNELTSLDIGVSRIYQYLEKPEVLSNEHLDRQLRYMESRVSPEFDSMRSSKMIGASGSFETFLSMLKQESVSRKVHKEPIDKKELLEVIDWTIHSSLSERMDNEWIIPIRKYMIPIAAYKVKWAMERLGTERVIISPYSLKEGALWHNS